MRRRALLAVLALVAALSAFALPALAGRTFAPGTDLRPDQRASLVLLGRVWGFAKYHHPRARRARRASPRRTWRQRMRMVGDQLMFAASAWWNASAARGGRRRPAGVGSRSRGILRMPGFPAR